MESPAWGRCSMERSWWIPASYPFSSWFLIGRQPGQYNSACRLDRKRCLADMSTLRLSVCERRLAQVDAEPVKATVEAAYGSWGDVAHGLSSTLFYQFPKP
jgi:hypothetical protein